MNRYMCMIYNFIFRIFVHKLQCNPIDIAI